MSTYSKLCNDVVDFNGKNSYNRGGRKITKITIHHMAGKLGAVACAKMHLSRNSCSANYYIGNDGKICGGVREEDGAWTSSNSINDKSAITIEVSNCVNSGEDAMWPISAAAYNSLILLCADICDRYGILPVYDGTKNGAMTEHRMFAATVCPGPTIHNALINGQIPNDILVSMKNKTSVQETNTNVSPVFADTKTSVPFMVRVRNFIDIYKDASMKSARVTVCPPGIYTIVEEKNGWGKLKSGKGYIDLHYTEKYVK